MKDHMRIGLVCGSKLVPEPMVRLGSISPLCIIPIWSEPRFIGVEWSIGMEGSIEAPGDIGIGASEGLGAGVGEVLGIGMGIVWS
jgi:hypothetical protein